MSMNNSWTLNIDLTKVFYRPFLMMFWLIDNSAYAKKSVAACLKAGIVGGTSNNTISPKKYVTRAEVAVMVHHVLQKAGLI